MPAFLLAGNGTPKHAARIRAVCRRHDADLILANIPGDGPRWWIEAKNLGHPFDDQRRDAITKELRDKDLMRFLTGEPGLYDRKDKEFARRVDSDEWPQDSCPDCKRGGACCQRHHHHDGDCCTHCGNDERSPRRWSHRGR